MEYLGSLEIDSLLLEGGGNLNESALRVGIINLDEYLSCKVFDWKGERAPIEGIGVGNPNIAYKFSFKRRYERIGSDLMITCKVDNLLLYIQKMEKTSV